MPSARAILAIKKLERYGRMVDVEPSLDDIEAEKFGRTFTVWIDTAKDQNFLVKELTSIKNIESITIEKKIPEKLEGKKEEVSATALPRKIGQEIASVRVKMDRLDDLLDTVGELIINKISLLEMSKTVGSAKMAEALRSLDRLTGELQYNVLRIRMVPIETVFSRYPRMIRDLAKQLGKEVEFIMEGQEIELDRTVIDKLGDLLVHLLRNSVDHGIEFPEAREKAGKSRLGTIRLSASQEQNRVQIKVEDNGRGIDFERIKKKAFQKKMFTKEQLDSMSDDEMISILATPGFSTAEKVTDVSGRGVGLDAVKSGVESLGGQMSIESAHGQWTRITIRLPLTLAIILTMLIRVGNEIYAVSIDPIVETISISDVEIKTIGGARMIRFRGEVVPLLYLSQVLGQSDNLIGNQVIIAEIGTKRIGIVVDELLGQQEIVVKPLDKHLRRVPFLGGATILGSGEVALILDMHNLTTYARELMKATKSTPISPKRKKGVDANA